MKKISFLLGLLTVASLPMHAQMDASIKLNEVMTDNQSSLIDEYGTRHAWVEIANISHSTYNIRGMYLTTDRSVLDKSMSVPERVKRMSIIPNGETRTNLSGRQLIVFQLNSQPAKGSLHLTVKVDPSKPTWIALYNGNATQLIDSVTVPVLQADQSYARIANNGTPADWEMKSGDRVTVGIQNITTVSESKIEKFKREDPHGFAMAIMAMSIVFLCLALLWIFFTLFGMFMRHQETAKKVINTQPIKPITKTVEKTMEVGHKTGVILQEGLKTKGIDKEVYLAVIGMALQQYRDDVHDVESGVITIKHRDTGWDDEYSQMTHFHEPVSPAVPQSQHIPTGPELK
ncbi:OadG family protein [Prevotella sp. tf2-5]|jgi:Na+-transporting methylmalonyl-CoA/oxaloacetate decarboxylase gamma subunit|uniref:OadG family protein n=1 Tax=Prevotella sp. tf2-5 TaxID=1761889 RepID=UPI0008E6ED96|nr:OadG family protein [Prevotella sp. tf2-5]SFO51773.1 Oxaloacetate decarboxylase, gamma chain [Prevotella sp. tf2-5]